MNREPAPRFKSRDPVRVRFADPPGHIRTPFYVRGKRGWIEHCHGAFRNPEELAYGKDGYPLKPLYLVGFKQTDLWERYRASPRDTLFVDIYEHWLEPDDARAASDETAREVNARAEKGGRQET